MDIVPLQLKIKNFFYEIKNIITAIIQYILTIVMKDFFRK